MDTFLLKIIGGVVLICVLAIMGSNTLMHKQCRNNIQEMGREYRYDLINGCRLQMDDGNFIYWKMYRNIDNY